MTYTESQIREAIDAWAETQVDAEIDSRIKRNVEYNEKYGGRNSYSIGGGKIPWPTSREEFNRDDVRSGIAEDFYNEMPKEGFDVPGLGLVKRVDSYGGEGQGDALWYVWQIGDEYYQADHYYNSYDVEPWHYNASIFPVEGREVTKIEWFPL